MMKKQDLKWPTIGHLLEDAANKYKDKIFLIYEGEKLSFQEVNRRVDQMANALKDMGITKEDKVSVMLPNGFEFPIAWLAIAKLGAIMVPTNINYNEHDLVYILTDSEASAIVIHDEYLLLLEKVRPQVQGLKHIIASGKASSGYPHYQSLNRPRTNSKSQT